MLTYRKVRRVLLVAMILGLAAMIAAWYLTGTPVLRKVLIWFGCGVYAVSLLVMFIGFRCPACGAHFYRNALFIRTCPVCGREIPDFTLGKKGRTHLDVWGSGSVSYTSDRLPDPRIQGNPLSEKNDHPQGRNQTKEENYYCSGASHLAAGSKGRKP